MNDIVRKTIDATVEKAPDSDGYRFVISSEEPDLMRDIVVQSGLTPVAERIPAQVDHSGRMADMVGVWKNFVVRAKKTYADLHLFERGISNTSDMIRMLLDQKVQLAASIGFVPEEDEYEFLDSGGIKFLKSKLIETSVVVVPANPHALSIIKSAGIDPAALRMSAPKPSHHTILKARHVLRQADMTLRNKP